MNKYAKTFLGILIVIIPAILVLGLLFNIISKKSFYPTTGEIAVSGLKSQVKVYFDDFSLRFTPKIRMMHILQKVTCMLRIDYGKWI